MWSTELASRWHDRGMTDEGKMQCNVGAWQPGHSLGHDMDLGVDDGTQRRDGG